MPLRHPAVALAKANRLEALQDTPRIYKAHAEVRFRPTDQPTHLRTRNLWEVTKTNLGRVIHLARIELATFSVTTGASSLFTNWTQSFRFRSIWSLRNNQSHSQKHTTAQELKQVCSHGEDDDFWQKCVKFHGDLR